MKGKDNVFLTLLGQLVSFCIVLMICCRSLHVKGNKPRAKAHIESFLHFYFNIKERHDTELLYINVYKLNISDLILGHEPSEGIDVDPQDKK